MQSRNCINGEVLYAPGYLNTVKLPVFPNLIYRFFAIPNKIPASYFVVNIHKITCLDSKVYMERQKTQNSQQY